MSRTTLRRSLALAATGALMIGSLVACGGGGNGSSGGNATATGGGSGGGKAGKIALLLPESKTTRYESFDRPYFEAKVKELCPNCQVVYSNADQDTSKQQQQAEAALTEGVNVMVLDPVDSTAAASITNSAKSQGVPVIAYDRFIKGAPIDYYISFDNVKVGELQGTALVDKMKADGKTSGNILMINGSPTDNNAGQFKQGAHSVLDKSGYKIAAEYDTPDWSPDKAQAWTDGQLAQSKDLVGVYAANDGTAGGAIAAMKASGMNPLPPVTGQDAELAAIQRILAGDQYMTVYKAIKPEAEKAAELAVALVNGQKPSVPDKVEGIPSVLLKPVAVTKDNIKDTVIADKFYTVDQICTADFAQACKNAGL
ncbi:MAG TPA: sugar ABC transporter substrate-binding protein [Actinomycetales bacterium]|nr:sugar ABC transporter substrate-binding protein [Actinomycetales bacterium]